MAEEGVGVEGAAGRNLTLFVMLSYRVFGTVPVFHNRINFISKWTTDAKLVFGDDTSNILLFSSVINCVRSNFDSRLGSMRLFVNGSSLLSSSLIPCLKALAD